MEMRLFSAFAQISLLVMFESNGAVTRQTAIISMVARSAAAVLIAMLLITYFITVLGVDECKALWTRGHTSGQAAP